MLVLNSIQAFRERHARCAATIGKYDGMHLGHQAVLGRLLEEARRLGLPSVVILSEPQPEEFFLGDKAPPRLNHFWDKVDFLRDFGVDAVFRLHFDEPLSRYEPERFIDEILVRGLGVKTLVVGHDFRFGRDRAGDLALLREHGGRAGFAVFSEDAHCLGGERVSSTLVRTCLQEEDFDGVRRLLGRPYTISGEVVKGRQLGRRLETPTANVKLAFRVPPLTGIYAVKVLVRGQEFNGVASIGYNPTVNKEPVPSLEVFLFDFDGDLYGAWVTVSFIKKIRDEENFPSLEALQRKIGEDVDAARHFFMREAGAGA